jgi:hypothetical protein
MLFSAVFLNRRAAARIIPGPRLIKQEFTGPQSHKGFEPLVSVVQSLKEIYRVLCTFSASFFYLQSFHLIQTVQVFHVLTEYYRLLECTGIK